MFHVQTLMRLARSRRTETAVVLGFLILSLVIGFSGWFSAGKLAQFIEASAVNRYLAMVVYELESVIGDISDAESQQRAYLLTANPDYLSTYDAALVQVREGQVRLSRLTAADPDLHPQMEAFKILLEERIDMLGEGIHLQRTGHPDRAREIIGLARPVANALRERYLQLQPQYQAALNQARVQVATLRADAIRSFVVTSAFAAVVLAFMAVMVILEARFIRALSKRMLHQSRHDELTGLPNRAYLNEWLARGIAAAKRSGEKLALLYLDLNGFKQVNDTLGHPAGDGVLVEVSRTLEKIARDSDFVSRLGGDEFAVVMPRVTDRTQVDAAATRFGALSVMRGALAVGASVGCATYPDDAQSAEALLKVGDTAMYARKQAAKRR